MSDVNRAVHALFPNGGSDIANLKFFPGSKQGVTPEELANEVARADAQIREGLAVRSTRLDGELTVSAD